VRKRERRGREEESKEEGRESARARTKARESERETRRRRSGRVAKSDEKIVKGGKGDECRG